MKDLNEKIIEWAKERELDKKGTVEGQSIKTAEEISELIKGISKDNIDIIKDSIGDVYVTLVIGNMLDKDFELEKIYADTMQMVDAHKDELQINKKGIIKVLANIMIWILTDRYSEENLYTLLEELITCASTYDLDFKDCVQSAYDEIANRKGKMINGTFVKEEDLPLEENAKAREININLKEHEINIIHGLLVDEEIRLKEKILALFEKYDDFGNVEIYAENIKRLRIFFTKIDDTEDFLEVFNRIKEYKLDGGDLHD